MNYLYQTASHLPTTNISGYLLVRVKASKSSNAVFHNETEKYGNGNNQCSAVGNPAKISLLLNTFGSDPRFWAEPPVNLTTGSATIVVPLQPHYWNDVYGNLADSSQALITQFNGVLANLQAIGMTFGGSCSDGHGVYITPLSATAKFSVVNYEILSQLPPACPATNTCSCGVPQVSFDDPVCSPGVDTGLTECTDLKCPAGQRIYRRTCPCQGTGCGTWSALSCGY
jgi:hypothetical protein